MKAFTREEAGDAAIAILAAIMKMSDHAEAMGAARSIAGVAALNTMQTSIQKNGPRLAAIATALLAPKEGA